MMGVKAIFVLLSAIAISTVAASNWSFEGARLTVSSIDGSARISESFTATKPPTVESPFEINSDEVLKLAFTLQGNGEERLKADDLPHQVIVSLSDIFDPLRVTSSIVSVKASTGKASWNQRMDRLPSVLTKGSGNVQVTLLIASFGEDAEAIKVPLLQLSLPTSVAESKAALSSREKQEIRQGFQRQIERRHTFNVPAADQMPPKLISLVAAAITFFLPSAALLILISQIMPSLSMRSPSSSTLPFLISLCSLEVLALFYWIGGGFTLFKMMPWLLALGTANIFVGKTALSEMRRVRLGKQA